MIRVDKKRRWVLLQNERGAALMACIIIALILVAGVVWFSNWSWSRGRTVVSQAASQHALEYADSGINETAPWLKSPTLKSDLPAGTSSGFTLTMPHGRCDVALYRRSADTGLVSAYATGYYYLSAAGGGTWDPQSQQYAQEASINSLFRISNVSEYLIAVPNALPISYGANAGNGLVYAGSLQFQSPPPVNPGPQTQMATALYYTDVSPSNYLSFVHFPEGSSGAQKLSYPPNFAVLDPPMRALYQQRAGTQENVPDFEGLVSEPATHVFFVSGDLQVAQNQPLIVQGVYVIYVTSSVYISNDITLADSNSCLAILAEKDILITEQAPDAVTIDANLVANGALDAQGAARPTGRFTLNGGLVTMGGNPQLSGVFIGGRSYFYSQCASPNFFLPNVTNTLQYDVVSGQNSLH